MKANITIASNIYNCANEDVCQHIWEDKNFVSQVTGKEKLEFLKEHVQLESWQEQARREASSCSYARNGEMTHGLVRKKDGSLVWEGRCEYEQCKEFLTCPETAGYKRLAPDLLDDNDRPASISPLLKFEWLGDIHTDELFSPQIVHEPEFIPPEAVIADVRAFVAQGEFEKIDDPSEIIEAPIESRILVNAAPGSGKTYTVIQRIEYVIHKQMVEDFSKVIVLVYTNAAKNEILNRIESGIREGALPPSARNTDICTFDSFASSYLAAIEERFAGLDYNKRIQLFNKRFKRDDFSNFEYVIVDELQDLVNERAKMTLNILGALQRGYLLLGDKCQAIYDYSCHDGDGEKINSVEFYNRLDKILPDTVKKYELTGNRRQSANEELSRMSDRLRHALLDAGPRNANKRIKEELSSLRVIGRIEEFDFSKTTERTAILCRNNGEAEYVSHVLRGKRVPHTLLRRAEQTSSLNRSIADCLWDYHADSRITKSVFTERYRARVSDDQETASSVFDALSEIAYGDVKEYIEIVKLAERLALAPRNSNIKIEPLLTVSTIHRAKGREFDTVYLLDSGFKPNNENTEEARVWYVGCTRAKRNLYKLNKAKIYLKSVKYTSRWVQVKFSKVKWRQKPIDYCTHIVLGLPDDFSDAGFVKGDLTAALRIQQYIAETVHIGDEAEVVLNQEKDSYQILHNKNIIGYLGKDMLRELREIAKGKKPDSPMPPCLSPVYITDIVTITPREFPEDIPPYFRESRFWLGVELSGFPRIDWDYRVNDR